MFSLIRADWEVFIGCRSATNCRVSMEMWHFMLGWAGGRRCGEDAGGPQQFVLTFQCNSVLQLGNLVQHEPVWPNEKLSKITITKCDNPSCSLATHFVHVQKFWVKLFSNPQNLSHSGKRGTQLKVGRGSKQRWAIFVLIAWKLKFYS